MALPSLHQCILNYTIAFYSMHTCISLSPSAIPFYHQTRRSGYHQSSWLSSPLCFITSKLDVMKVKVAKKLGCLIVACCSSLEITNLYLSNRDSERNRFPENDGFAHP